MRSLGIGIIGSGFMGRTYAETVSKYCEQAELKAVAGGSRASSLASDYGMDFSPDIESLLSREDIEVVFVTTPHDAHAQQALAVAAAGKHVMLEKPMACTVEDCDAIIAACEKSGLCCSIGFTQRSRKCNIKAKEIIDSDRLGQIRQMIEWQYLPGGLEAFPKWQSQSGNLGILIGHAIHNFDRIRWFSGAEIISVFAKCTSYAPNADVESTSVLLMTLSNGTVATLFSSGEMPQPNFPRTEFACWVVGEKALIDLDAFGELRSTCDGTWKVVETQEPIDWQGKGFLDPVRLQSHAKHCQGFFKAIREGSQPPVTGWDGRQAVAAALAAYESSKTGKEIFLT